jgi:hypothetical protein
MSLAAPTYVAEGLCLSALLALNVQNFLICLVSMKLLTVYMAFYFALKNTNKK